METSSKYGKRPIEDTADMEESRTSPTSFKQKSIQSDPERRSESCTVEEIKNPNEPSASSKSMVDDITKYLNRHEAILEGMLESVVKFSKGDKIRLESLLLAKRNSNSLALLLPIFTGVKYGIWSVKMKTYFLSRDLWDTVHQGISIPQSTSSLSTEQEQSMQNDAAALFILQQAVDDNIFSKISGAQTAKEAWDALKQEFQGNLPAISSSASSEQTMQDCTNDLKLYKAILEGKDDLVQQLCVQHLLEARITENLDTALHVAVGTGKTNCIVESLLDKMSIDQVSLQNKEGNTVLSVAAIVGNRDAANKIMMKDTDRILINVTNKSGWTPLILAARHGQRKMIEYLLPFSGSSLSYTAGTRSEDKSGVEFLHFLINARFYDLVNELLEKYEELATKELYGGESLLSVIARNPSAFPSGRQREPKERQETKKDNELLILVRSLCKKISEKLNREKASSILKIPLLLAAEMGIHEMVEAIIESFPYAIWFTNDKNHNIFHLAVKNRQDKVFNLILKMTDQKHLHLMPQDTCGNNVLHLAAESAPKYQLNRIAGAPLQMQSELQWFKKVEEIVPLNYKEEKNSEGKTPRMLFTEKHEGLVKEGEKWMKDTATACTIAAALIATVVFAAAISIPGNYDGEGKPNFFEKPAFTIFNFADAISLFSSVAAIIMFLSILTARYAEYDFLCSLPTKLILGLLMLFLSLISLMLAFCTAIYIVFYEKLTNWGWGQKLSFGIEVGLAIVPLLMFMFSQYPLLRKLISSTYGPEIYRKRATCCKKSKETMLKLADVMQKLTATLKIHKYDNLSACCKENRSNIGHTSFVHLDPEVGSSSRRQ